MDWIDVNDTMKSTPTQNLAAAIRARFAPLGGVELDLPAREAMPEPVGDGRTAGWLASEQNYNYPTMQLSGEGSPNLANHNFNGDASLPRRYTDPEATR
jgi:hypothetical protein